MVATETPATPLRDRSSARTPARRRRGSSADTRREAVAGYVFLSPG